MLTDDEVSGLETVEFVEPGPLRDRLVAAVASGAQTTTTALEVQYTGRGEALPQVGDRGVVVDSDGKPVCIIELTQVRIASLGSVNLEHAQSEIATNRTVAEWRAEHEAFWHGPGFRAYLGDPDFTVDDRTQAVLIRFHVIAK